MGRLSSNSQGVTKTIDPRSAGVAGEVKQYTGTSAPSGYLECQGQAVSRSLYSQLFSRIGTKYGVGDGSTTFNLPDGPLRSKQFDLSLSSTPTGWATSHANGYLEKIEGKWYLDFSISGPYTASSASQSMIIDGVTSSIQSAVSTLAAAAIRSNGYYNSGSNNLSWYVTGGSAAAIRIQGHIEIDAPTDAILAASSYSTLSEVWESIPIIKLYDDSTTAVSVSVAEATVDTAGVAKTSEAADDTQQYLVPEYREATVVLTNSGTDQINCTLRITKIGNLVTVFSEGTVLHLLSSSVDSAIGVIPAWAVPTTYDATNVFYSDANRFQVGFVYPDGKIKLLYRDYAGAAYSATSTSRPFNVSYIVI